MKIVIAPSGFKECLDAEEVASAMERGARRFDPSIHIHSIPMIDGGEGFAKAIIKLKGGQLHYREVTGPVGQKILSHFGLYEDRHKRTAVIEMAAAAGLKLVPRDQRNPLQTTTCGVGELILSALDLGVDRILIGCGDSGTSDGGAGMAQTLGARFFDESGRLIHIQGGGDLLRAASVDISRLDKRLDNTIIDVACNWKNVLCGEQGVARIFGPQKGATPEQVEQLAAALEHYASLIQEAVSLDVRLLPGSGASGGLGAGLAAFAGAFLHPRFHIISDYINIEERISEADIVMTAEGSIDFQTPNEKIPSEVARIAKKNNIPVIALTGTIGRGAELNYRAGIDAYCSIIQKPATLETAMKNAPLWIEQATESVLRQVAIGLGVAKKNLELYEVYQK